MSQVDLYYLSPNTTGGWVTYTYHLARTLEAQGHEVRLFKVRPKTERTLRPFGYGLRYQNVSLSVAVGQVEKNPSIIVAGAKNFRNETSTLYHNGAHLIVHDPTELKNLPELSGGERCAVIRKVALRALPRATFIRHPYVRFGNEHTHEKTVFAISTCRIDFDKRTHILLDANRLLPDDKKITIRGFENRLYTRFKICPNYPEWVQSINHYDRTENAAYELLSEARIACDMSVIKGDGGGTQYSFLEAWDAGCHVIINEEWIHGGHTDQYGKYDDDMQDGENCTVVEDGETLAEHLMQMDDIESECIVEGGFRSLEKHDPKIIGPRYEEFLGL
jgi:hypothetical protein